jgi:hypothetical protein
MMMPAQPTAKLIIAQAQFLFAILETTLDGPTQATDPDKSRQRGVGGRIAEIILGFATEDISATD